MNKKIKINVLAASIVLLLIIIVAQQYVIVKVQPNCITAPCPAIIKLNYGIHMWLWLLLITIFIGLIVHLIKLVRRR